MNLMRQLTKVISMLIIACLMITIANIPVYAKVNATSAVRLTDAVLSKQFMSPLQAVKQSTVKTKSVKKTTKAKKINVSNKTIIKKYGKKGLSLLKKLAGKLSLSLNTVYNKFVKFGVTKKQINKVYSTIVKQIKKGVGFVNCASLAVAKYLGINRNLAALQNLAGDIVSGSFLFNNSKTFKGVIGTGDGSTLTLKKNGKKVENYDITLKKFMSGLKKGDKALLSVDCYNKKGKNVGGHAITVVKEKNGYGVFDTLSNGGEEVIYSKKEFEKFMNGKSAKGKTKKGKIIKKPVYYTNTTSGTIRYKPLKNGKLDVTTDSKGVIKAANNGYIKTVKNIEKQAVKISLDTLMNGLKVGESSTVKVRGFGDIFYNGGTHYITVTREKNGYGITDANVNNGKKVIYNASDFQRFMIRQKTKVTGIDAKTGKKVITETYYGAVEDDGLITCTSTIGITELLKSTK